MHLSDKEIAKIYLYISKNQYERISDKESLHLDECYDCKKKLVDLYRADKLITKETQKDKSKLIIYAVTASVVIGLFTIFFGLNQKYSTIIDRETKELSWVEENPELLTNSFLDNLERDMYRDPSLPVVNLEKREYNGREIIKIIVDRVKENVTIKLLNAEGGEYQEVLVKAKRGVYKYESKISAPIREGKYYITIENDKEILAVISFMVN